MGMGVWMKDGMGRMKRQEAEDVEGFYTCLQGPRFWFTSRHHVTSSLHLTATHFRLDSSLTLPHLTSRGFYPLIRTRGCHFSILFLVNDAKSTPSPSTAAPTSDNIFAIVRRRNSYPQTRIFQCHTPPYSTSFSSCFLAMYHVHTFIPCFFALFLTTRIQRGEV